MYWAALLFPRLDGSRPSADPLHGLATWALQFSPRVALIDEAVLVELRASLKLFGGLVALQERLRAGASELGVSAIAWAPTCLAALAFSRAGVEDAGKQPLDAALDALPLATLSATAPHRETLGQLGCRTLGDLRRLPRGGLGRRFGKSLLEALDVAYGLRPHACTWVTLPERFQARLELAARVELAPALLFGARRLLLQMTGWLAARHAGTTVFTLRWAHDALRAREAGEGGALTIRTAEPTRDVDHLCRLLGEHLARVALAAPVDELELAAGDVQPLALASMSLLPHAVQEAESLHLTLERLAARLGPQRVQRPVLAEDHRLEWMQHWQPATQPLPRQVARGTDLPQPTFILDPPLRLAMQGARPLYQGPLTLLAGPQRIEGGWWHRVTGAAGQRNLQAQRDYWVARSAHAGLLWIYQERLANEEHAGWYLHGTFA